MEEARFGAQPQLYYGMPSTDLRAMAKRGIEWDPNDWRWDGDLFIATPLHPTSSNFQSRQLFPLQTQLTTTVASSNSCSSFSDELDQPTVKDNRELEKKRRVQDNNLSADNLTLNLGGRGYAVSANTEPTTGKKTKLAAPTPNRAVCQVDDCGADLSKAKDYHRRHKVCEMHSKASKALVANQMQRFCQQCSRFHALQEFDEGKRSCRRRLAGHNKRRRKTQTENVSNSSPINDNQASGYLLMSILKILSNMHSNRSNQTDDQDLLSHLLQTLASQGPFRRNISAHLQESQDLLNNLPSLGNSESVPALLSNDSLGQRSMQEHCTTTGDEMPRKIGDLQASSQRPGIVLHTQATSQIYDQGRETSGGRSKLNNFDLNDIYVDSDDGMDDIERSTVPQGLGIGCPSWAQQESHQSSPPQTSGNSDSASAQSPSSSSGEAQSHTDRIVFKLFGKEPSDFPIVLRAQIFDWLSHSPTDIESYIRPGCVILTIYLRLSESSWEELYCDLSSSLNRLLNIYDDVYFWSTGWIYARVQNQMAFVYNGQVVVNTSLPLGTDNYTTILSVKPIAVASSGQAQFFVKGINLSRPSTRLLCALDGNYVEASTELVEHVDGLEGSVQYLKFSCSVPAVTGRGFIEVEDHGLSSSFFPFIVCEDDVCTEICMLEKEIELTDIDNLHRGRFYARNQAMEFIHEMGWLLHKLQSKLRFGHEGPNLGSFPFERFKYLVEFSMDHDWCSVVNKLLDILFYGIVSGGEQPFVKFALSEMGLLHRAVRRNSRSLVEMLLRYVPEEVADELSSEYQSLVEIDKSSLFRPDVAGPGGLTPLHVAAGRDGSEDILDALTDDPGKVGIGAWKSALDSTGFTPEDYARLRGHYSYIHLVQRKINRRVSSGHVVVDISDTVSDSSINQKPNMEPPASFEIGIKGIQRPCGVCAQNMAYRTGSRTLLYRPAMLSMLAIAAVCVCVAILMKSLPRVLFVFRPFSWEMLEYGSS
ncbi:squamosa promoter-binding-like protein 1 [Sesamum indicum]|uniref:Squamosa promoter-binding-like protein 1 n=1 Tax=Sesamum indicum TaxID=4182 RepID=A0A6I9TAT1_SESIN|nr:squamosa promoter-binding-like protein 1 [Sesamum indicum]